MCDCDAAVTASGISFIARPRLDKQPTLPAWLERLFSSIGRFYLLIDLSSMIFRQKNKKPQRARRVHLSYIALMGNLTSFSGM